MRFFEIVEVCAQENGTPDFHGLEASHQYKVGRQLQSKCVFCDRGLFDRFD